MNRPEKRWIADCLSLAATARAARKISLARAHLSAARAHRLYLESCYG